MTGTLTISVEVELGWGVHDLASTDHLSVDGAVERTYLRRLLRKADSCGIPMTFDIVGHLLLESCTGSHEGPYPEGWFDADPGTSADEAPLFYAPDMAAQIREASVGHELGTHTFSHVLCGEVSEAVLDVEFERVQQLHAAAGEPATSFVPPRHQEPPRAVLERNGISAVRYARERPVPTRLHRMAELTIGPHPNWPPRSVDGILETYCTTYPSLTARSLPAGQRSPHPVFRPVPFEVRRRLHRRYLRGATERAIDSNASLHLWCHLYDLCNPHQWAVIGDFLEYLSARPSEQLSIARMADLTPGVD